MGKDKKNHAKRGSRLEGQGADVNIERVKSCNRYINIDKQNEGSRNLDTIKLSINSYTIEIAEKIAQVKKK